jgi:hypothetical protein
MAATGGHIEVVEILLGAGATVNPEKTDSIKAAIQGAELHKADSSKFGGYVEVVRALIRAGAELSGDYGSTITRTRIEADGKQTNETVYLCPEIVKVVKEAASAFKCKKPTGKTR